MKMKYGYYGYELLELDFEKWTYTVHLDEERYDSEEVFDSRMQANFAAIGMITMLEQGHHSALEVYKHIQHN